MLFSQTCTYSLSSLCWVSMHCLWKISLSLLRICSFFQYFVIVLRASFSMIVNALGERLSSSQIRVSFETVLGFREDLLCVRF